MKKESEYKIGDELVATIKVWDKQLKVIGKVKSIRGGTRGEKRYFYTLTDGKIINDFTVWKVNKLP